MRKSVPGFAVLLAATAVSYSIVTSGAIGLSAALAASSEAANPNLPAQTSSARGVTIKVAPKNLATFIHDNHRYRRWSPGIERVPSGTTQPCDVLAIARDARPRCCPAWEMTAA